MMHPVWKLILFMVVVFMVVFNGGAYVLWRESQPEWSVERVGGKVYWHRAGHDVFLGVPVNE